MLEILRNAWKIQDLRRKILYTLLMLLVFRLGSFIPIPGVNIAALGEVMKTNGLLQMLDLFSGGAMANFTVFAAGITPYITASIVMQLLAVAIPSLEALQKEGEQGRAKINQYTRILGVVMAFITALGMALTYGSSILTNPAWYNYAYVAAIATGGSALCMWIGERITEKGIGNGISLLIFINIISRIPSQINALYQNMFVNGSTSPWLLPVIIVALVVIIVAVVLIDLGQRRIPVQYAKKMVGRRMYGGQSTHIPMKVNNSGVMPLIFASTMLQFPTIILMFWPNALAGYNNVMAAGKPLYAVIMSLLILFFAYFYSSIAFNPVEIAKNLQQNGGFIPGIRPGIQTGTYLQRVCNRITLFSAVFLAVLALVPTLFSSVLGISGFAATSILILVSVALETSKSLESQMLMRHYKGFLK